MGIELKDFWAQYNMETKSLFKVGVGIVTTVSLAACAVAEKQGWINVIPDNSGIKPTTSEIDPNLLTEVAKITSATMTEITDQTRKDEILKTLPQERPEARNQGSDVTVYAIQVGDKTFNAVSYPLSDEAIKQNIADGLVFNNPDGTQWTPQTLLYTEAINDKGDKIMVVSLPSELPDGRTAWFSLINPQSPVIAYSHDGSNATYNPLISPLQSNYIEGYQYNTPIALNTKNISKGSGGLFSPIQREVEAPLPAEFKDLQNRLGSDFKLYDLGEKDPEGKVIMGMKDKDGNIVESVKVYADGTTGFVYNGTDLLIASVVVDAKHLGPWHIENGKIIIDTAPAPKTIEDIENFPKLAYLEGHPKENEIYTTIRTYVQMATAETAESEFDEVYYKGKKIEPRTPTFYQSQTEALNGTDTIYLDNSWDQIIALKQGYASLSIYDTSGNQRLESKIIPILIKDTDGSFFSEIGLIDQDGFSKILNTNTLTNEGRDRAIPFLAYIASDTNMEMVLTGKDLQQFIIDKSQELLADDVIKPYMEQLPQELRTNGFWIFWWK